jgi:hypothetical protein
VTQPQPIETIFSRSWALLTHNWIIIVPGIVIGIVVGIIGGALAPPSYAFGAAARGLIILAVSVVAFVANQAYTTGMAGAAWERGNATIADGAASFKEDAGRIVVTTIGLLVIGFVAVVLAPFTLGLSVLAAVLFSLYALPAAIVGNRPGIDSIRESFAITRARFVPTLLLAILLCVIAFLMVWVAALLSFAPFVGPLVSAIVMQCVVAYGTLVVVGEYLNLRAAAVIPPASPSPPAA